MADANYSWSDVRGERAYRLPGPDHLGWWAAAAMLVSILLHVVVFFALDHLKIALGFESEREISTGPVHVHQVEISPMDEAAELPPEEMTVETNDLAPLLDEIDLLEMLPPDQEIDIRPDALEPSYAIQLANPVMEGDPAALALEMTSGLEVEADLPELGRMEEHFPPAAVGQVTVDPGAVQANDLDLEQFTEDLLKHGAGGQMDHGALEGLTSLDDMLGLPANALVDKKTLLPSDLLFEFNRAELRESAKLGLMKLGLLIDLNPGLHTWIEGHTDRIGGDDFNLELSQRRAEAVKTYLVESMRMDPSRIHARGYGRSQPLVPDGDREAQAPNRRVEIRMRPSPPPDSPLPVRALPAEDLAASVPEPVAEPVPPRAVLVRPQRSLEEAEEIAPRAVPVEDEVPRATPVDEPPPPRALPVEE